MRKFYELHKKPINQIITFLLVLVLLFMFFKYAFMLFAPFLTAFVLSLILSVPVDILTNKVRIPRAASTILSMLFILSALIYLINLALKMLLTQLVSFSTGFPDAFDSVMTMLKGFQSSYYDFFAIFPEDAQNIVDQAIMTSISSLTAILGDAAKAFSLTAVKGIPKTFIFLLITLISTFFMTYDRRKIRQFIARQLPESFGKTITVLKKDIFGALWGYIKAQLILMSISGCIAVTGLTVLGYEYSLLIGVAVAFFDALPVFGPGFVLWPWAAFSFISGRYSFAVGLIVIYLVIIVCRQLIEPKVLGSQIGLYPIVTLMALYVGLSVLGPVGLIAGPLFVIVVKSLQNAGLLPGWK